MRGGHMKRLISLLIILVLAVMSVSAASMGDSKEIMTIGYDIGMKHAKANKPSTPHMLDNPSTRFKVLGREGAYGIRIKDFNIRDFLRGYRSGYSEGKNGKVTTSIPTKASTRTSAAARTFTEAVSTTRTGSRRIGVGKQYSSIFRGAANSYNKGYDTGHLKAQYGETPSAARAFKMLTYFYVGGRVRVKDKIWNYVSYSEGYYRGFSDGLNAPKMQREIIIAKSTAYSLQYTPKAATPEATPAEMEEKPMVNESDEAMPEETME